MSVTAARIHGNARRIAELALADMQTEARLADAAGEPLLAEAIQSFATAIETAVAEFISEQESAEKVPDVAASADHLLSDQSPTEGGPMT